MVRRTPEELEEIKRTAKKKAGRPKKADGEKRTKNFSGYFEQELMDALRDDAKDEKRPINSHVVYILEKYLKDKGRL